jgi:hypothetical protein
MHFTNLIYDLRFVSLRLLTSHVVIPYTVNHKPDRDHDHCMPIF